MDVRLEREALNGYLDDVFPQIRGRVRAIDVAPGVVRAEYLAAEGDLRPGGTVSGPAMFMLADCAFYMVVLSALGREALAVTTNCSINFLRKPAPGRLEAEARILKLGKTLCVGDVLIRSAGVAGPVAQASLTYSIPPRRSDMG
ncbi:MAG: PaaI family thioesterase [Pseudomonadota bacterium]